MKNLRILLLIVFVTGTCLAQGNAFSFQGRLNDGTTPANGSYDLQFSLYTAIVGGSQIGSTVPKPNTTLVNGVFSVTLDFGAAAFNDPNAVFIEIGIKPNGSPNAFTILGPRQQLTVVPFAVRANDSAQLGGIAASEYVTSTSSSFIRNSPNLQSGRFNLLGDSVIAGNFGVGLGSSPGNGNTLDVLGASRFRPPSGGSVQVGSPNGETGVSVIRDENRADVRFDGSAIRILAGTGLGPPPSTNGIAISTSGNVGIGTPAPATAPNAKLYVDGNAAQPASRRGLPKAIISVNQDGFNVPYFVDCYNGVNGETFSVFPASTCGFAITGFSNGVRTIITFPFSLSNPRPFIFLQQTSVSGDIRPTVVGNEIWVDGPRSFDLLIF